MLNDGSILQDTQFDPGGTRYRPTHTKRFQRIVFISNVVKPSKKAAMSHSFHLDQVKPYEYMGNISIHLLQFYYKGSEKYPCTMKGAGSTFGSILILHLLSSFSRYAWGISMICQCFPIFYSGQTQCIDL